MRSGRVHAARRGPGGRRGGTLAAGPGGLPLPVAQPSDIGGNQFLASPAMDISVKVPTDGGGRDVGSDGGPSPPMLEATTPMSPGGWGVAPEPSPVVLPEPRVHAEKITLTPLDVQSASQRSTFDAARAADIWHDVAIGPPLSPGRVTFGDNYFTLKRSHEVIHSSDFASITVADKSGGKALLFALERPDVLACRSWLRRLERERDTCYLLDAEGMHEDNSASATALVHSSLQDRIFDKPDFKGRPFRNFYYSLEGDRFVVSELLRVFRAAAGDDAAPRTAEAANDFADFLFAAFSSVPTRIFFLTFVFSSPCKDGIKGSLQAVQTAQGGRWLDLTAPLLLHLSEYPLSVTGAPVPLGDPLERAWLKRTVLDTLRKNVTAAALGLMDDGALLPHLLAHDGESIVDAFLYNAATTNSTRLLEIVAHEGVAPSAASIVSLLQIPNVLGPTFFKLCGILLAKKLIKADIFERLFEACFTSGELRPLQQFVAFCLFDRDAASDAVVSRVGARVLPRFSPTLFDMLGKLGEGASNFSRHPRSPPSPIV